MVTNTPAPPASRLHHHAYVVDDMEATRHFYEDVLGFPLVATWCEIENVRGKEREYIHTFFELADGSALAFFQFADAADQAEMRLDSRNSLNHVALNTDAATQELVRGRLDAAKVNHRSINHGYCVSLYILDPDGLTVEFTVDADGIDEVNERQRRTAHDELARWLAGDHRPNNHVRV